MGNIKAVIFDVDGLILDSEAFYAKAWSDTFDKLTPKKYRVEEEVMMDWFYNNLSGKKIGNQLEYIQSVFSHSDIQKIYREYRILFRERLKTEAIEVRHGFFELIKFLRDKKIKLALATTSSSDTLQKYFQNSKIDMSNFEVIVTGDIGLEYKPSPQPYLKACELLKLKPNDVIALEDSSSGVMSVVNANIRCVLIPGRAPVDEVAKQKAFMVCKDLAEVIDIIDNEIDLKI